LPDSQAFFKLLADEEIVPDDENLPDTGVPSTGSAAFRPSLFVQAEITARASTVVAWQRRRTEQFFMNAASGQTASRFSLR
jgi:uncharacterized protein with NRDE domain